MQIVIIPILLVIMLIEWVTKKLINLIRNVRRKDM